MRPILGMLTSVPKPLSTRYRHFFAKLHLNIELRLQCKAFTMDLSNSFTVQCVFYGQTLNCIANVDQKCIGIDANAHLLDSVINYVCNQIPHEFFRKQKSYQRSKECISSIIEKTCRHVSLVFFQHKMPHQITVTLRNQINVQILRFTQG